MLKNADNQNRNEDFIIEYQKLYTEVREKINLSSKNEIYQKKIHQINPTSNKEIMLYKFLLKMKIPESLIGIIICSLKKYILLFNRS